MTNQNVLSVPAGTLTLQPAAVGAQQSVQFYDVTWTPDPTMALYLPPGFVWQFRVGATANFDEVRVLPDGMGKWEQFNVKALKVGLAVAEYAGVTQAEREYDQIMYLFLIRARHTQKWLKNHLVDARALIGSRALGGSAKTVLEELGVGCTSTSNKSITVKVLLARGRQECLIATGSRASEQQLIATGLYHVARDTPCNISQFSPQNRRNLVRNALLDYPCREPDQSHLNEVFNRFRAAVPRHLDVAADPEFKWMMGNKNSLVQQLLKGSPKLQRDVVNDALAVIGWRAFQRVDAVCTKGSELLAHALGSKFGAVATASFHQVFTPHALLGGLCFTTMVDRLPLLAPALDDLLERPGDPVTHGAIIQLLIWYREIADFRRPADKGYKQAEGKFVNTLSANDVSAVDTAHYSTGGDGSTSKRTTKPKSHSRQAAKSGSGAEPPSAAETAESPATNTTPGEMSDRERLIKAIQRNVAFKCKCSASNQARGITLEWSEENEIAGVVIHECQLCGAVGTTYHTVEELTSMLLS